MIGSYTQTKAVRETRRALAENVQAANKRTPREQLAHLDEHGFTATKERAKLALKLKKEAEAHVAHKKEKKNG